MNQPPSDHSKEVQEYYGKTLQHSTDLKTNACCTIPSYPAHIQEAINLISDEVKDKYYGCGLTIPTELEGLSVLDLGSGSGRDSYVMSRLVGEGGLVTGVDMTPEQLKVARDNVKYHTEAFGYKEPNIRFLEGDIQELDQVGIDPESIDLAISNCVINLVNDKKKVLQAVYDALKVGGEIYFSDVYADRRIPTALVDDPVLYGECLSGALYWNDFLKIAKEVGFIDPRWMEIKEITVNNDELEGRLEGYHFYSVTARLFKLPALDPNCEDYGQAVEYLGSIPESPKEFPLDSGHLFKAGKIEPVCGNSYRMLAETRFAKHFRFYGSFETHFGVYAGCGESMPFTSAADLEDGGCGC